MEVKLINYYVVQGWMYNLGLNNTQELNAFAIVYGFSQDGQSVFKGTIGYIADCLMCTKRTATKVMHQLEAKGLIFIDKEEVSRVVFNRYRVNMEKISGVVKNFHGGSENNSVGVVKNFHPYNNSNKDNYKDPPLYISPLTGENISPQGEKSKNEVEVEEVEVEEAKPKKPKVKIEKNPLNMDCVPEDLVDVVNTWLNYKKEKQQTYKQSGFNAMVKKLIAYSGGEPQIAQQIIDNAMAANYIGFFPLKNNGQQQTNLIMDVIHGAVEMSLKREKYEKQRNQQQQSDLYNDIF